MRRSHFFGDGLPPALIGRLVGLSPRSMRIVNWHAITTTASEGRREIRATDLPRPATSHRTRIGFV